MEDDIPPEWMWPFEDELSEWFDEVRAARENPSSSPKEDREEVPLMENELAKR